MAPLTKDSVELAGSASEVASPRPAAPQAKPITPAAGGQLRADARSVEIPVKVHGSRVSDAPAGSAPRTEPFEEQTSTMIVFPQGSVIRMSTAVTVGQMLVVTNLKTRQDAICRVVKVRTFTNMQGYVEVEFTHKQEGYWGVQFSAGSPAAPVAAAPPAVSTSPVIPAPVVSAPAPKPPVSSAQKAVGAPTARLAIPRMPDGKPNLNGIWQAINTANWDLVTHGPSQGPPAYGTFLTTPPGMGVVEADDKQAEFRQGEPQWYLSLEHSRLVVGIAPVAA